MNNVAKMITSLIGLTGLYLKNPNFNKLKMDMKQYRNYLGKVNPDSVDVFKYVDAVHKENLISNKEAKMIFDLLLLFRKTNPDMIAIRANLIAILVLLNKKLRKYLDASIIMLMSAIEPDNIESYCNIIYSYLKRKRVDMDYTKYYKLSRKK